MMNMAQFPSEKKNKEGRGEKRGRIMLDTRLSGDREKREEKQDGSQGTD